MRCLRVGASVGHGQQTRLVVLQLEVLISELLAVDGLATGSLGDCELLFQTGMFLETYVATGEVTTLEHEVGDDSVEGRTSVAEALLASAESTEVLSGLGDHVVEEVELDATRLLCRGQRQLMLQQVRC